MHRILCLVAWLGLSLSVPSCVLAEEDGFKFPSRSPFPASSGDEDSFPPRARDAGGETESGFTWPSLPKPKLPALPKPALPKLSMPSWTTKSTSTARSKVPEPSMWEKMNDGTRSLYSKTKQALMPWADDETSTARTSSGTTRRPARTSSRSKAKTGKKSFFSSWFSPKDEERPIQSVSQYLAQPRVPIE